MANYLVLIIIIIIIITTTTPQTGNKIQIQKTNRCLAREILHYICCINDSLIAHLSEVKVHYFDEIFRETDQYGVHAPVCGEVSCDDGPYGT